MRFWHIVKDSEGVIREQLISNNNNTKLSLECLETILNGTYQIIPQK